MNYDYFNIIDLERTLEYKVKVYWKRTKFGYTTDVEEAGKFLYEDAKNICDNDINKNTVMLPIKNGA